MRCEIWAKPLNEIEECEYENPDKVNEVPVETNFLNQFIVFFLIKGPFGNKYKHDEVDHNSAEYVKAVKAGNEEKEITKQRCRPVFVLIKVSTMNIFYRRWFEMLSFSTFHFSSIME